MHIVKDFYVCKTSGCVIYEHSTTINGKNVCARIAIPMRDAETGRAPPMDYITVALRRQLEAEIGNVLYKGAR